MKIRVFFPFTLVFAMLLALGLTVFVTLGEANSFAISTNEEPLMNDLFALRDLGLEQRMQFNSSIPGVEVSIHNPASLSCTFYMKRKLTLEERHRDAVSKSRRHGSYQKLTIKNANVLDLIRKMTLRDFFVIFPAEQYNLVELHLLTGVLQILPSDKQEIHFVYRMHGQQQPFYFFRPIEDATPIENLSINMHANARSMSK
ncbi:MAG: hypothetical protein AB7F43_04420 [Bacteriovoracia bacterium]